MERNVKLYVPFFFAIRIFAQFIFCNYIYLFYWQGSSLSWFIYILLAPLWELWHFFNCDIQGLGYSMSCPSNPWWSQRTITKRSYFVILRYMPFFMDQNMPPVNIRASKILSLLLVWLPFALAYRIGPGKKSCYESLIPAAYRRQNWGALFVRWWRICRQHISGRSLLLKMPLRSQVRRVILV